MFKNKKKDTEYHESEETKHLTNAIPFIKNDWPQSLYSKQPKHTKVQILGFDSMTDLRENVNKFTKGKDVVGLRVETLQTNNNMDESYNVTIVYRE